MRRRDGALPPPRALDAAARLHISVDGALWDPVEGCRLADGDTVPLDECDGRGDPVQALGVRLAGVHRWGGRVRV